MGKELKRALLPVSRLGRFKEAIEPSAIKSREQYRALCPLIDEETKKVVTWVKGTWGEKIKRRRHFRILSGKRSKYFIDYTGYTKERKKSLQSDEHKKAKEVLIEALKSKLDNKHGMYWSFKNENISSFYFKGNILCAANHIQDEFHIKTGFNKDFFLDVAVLGLDAKQEVMVLFGIEIERSSRFSPLKAVLCQTLGFPFISVDISEMKIDDINLKWAESVLTRTTLDDELGLRNNFVYVPPILYPLYIRTDGKNIHIDHKHQYMVFAKDSIILDLKEKLERERDSLGLTDSINITNVNGHKNTQALHEVRLVASIIGKGWNLTNNKQYLRISLPRPHSTHINLNLFKFYLLMARHLLSVDTLVGYKYEAGPIKHQIENDLWAVYEPSQFPRQPATKYDYLPKLLSAPLYEVADLLGLE